MCKTIISFDNESIYKKILTENNLEFLTSNYIIGIDLSEQNYYDIYIKLQEHFKRNTKNIGAYVCLCDKGYYHVIGGNGYPTENNKNEKCSHCRKNIGSESYFLFFDLPQ